MNHFAWASNESLVQSIAIAHVGLMGTRTHPMRTKCQVNNLGLSHRLNFEIENR